ncbi:MAG TPA: glutathione S-transferase family protein [Candidatus Binataceae bacterium]|nr:glutathione S-transferase family protein [Candidatus Binataceae bacterium]
MPSLFKIFWEIRKPEGERNHERINEGWAEAQKHFAWMEGQLDGRDYFADEYGLGDISFVPPLANLERAGYLIPDKFVRLNAWWKRMKARPSFAASWPSD